MILFTVVARIRCFRQNAIIKVILDKVINDKIALISTGAGILVGAVAGYLYSTAIGCDSGTWSSHPLNSTLYGSMMGGLVFNMFVKRKSNPVTFFLSY
jgi:hypothetical protein